MRKITLITLILAIITGCGGNTPPEWYTSPPQLPGYYQGFGASTAKNDEEGFAKAKELALQDLSQNIKVEVTSSITSWYKQEAGEGLGKFQEEMEQNIQTKAQLILKDATVKAREKKGDTYYAWVIIPASVVESLLQAEKERTEKLRILPKKEMEKAVAKLAKHLPKNAKVGAWNISHANTGMAGNYSDYLRDLLSFAISSHPSLTDVTPRLASLAQKVPLDIALERRTTDIDGIMQGKYWERQKGIEVVLYLNTKGGGRHTTSFFLPKEAMEDLLPPNAELISTRIRETQRLFPREDFRVRIWVDRGEGSIYRDGDTMLVYVWADRDCYIKVFYISTQGEITLIFPNQYQQDNFLPGGIARTLGGEESPFAFVASAPYGSEVLKIVAQSKQFSDIEEIIQGQWTKGKQALTHGVIRSPKVLLAEDICTYTVLRR